MSAVSMWRADGHCLLRVFRVCGLLHVRCKDTSVPGYQPSDHCSQTSCFDCPYFACALNAKPTILDLLNFAIKCHLYSFVLLRQFLSAGHYSYMVAPLDLQEIGRLAW